MALNKYPFRLIVYALHTLRDYSSGNRSPFGARRVGVVAGVLCALALLALLPGGAATAEEAELPEWTVMLYMCGTDLESAYGLGSYNLNDIASMWFPEQVTAITEDGLSLREWPTDQVNLIVQTGGALKWHSMEPDEKGRTLGVDIPTDRLARYAFDLIYSTQTYGYMPTISLVDTQPLASMSDPDTLSDFIRWTVKEYPAKKYALVLWDHGGGSRTGLFVDELFDLDIMYLYELGQALADSGTHLELVAIDACLMCSVETARMIAPYANFMVASEEVAAGYGSAFPQWLLEVYRNPACDGSELACEFCDATQRKYVDMGNTMEETQLTFSVIDLSCMDALSEAFDRLFEFAGQLYEQMPSRFNIFCNILIYSEKYGVGGADMYDLGSFLYNENAVPLLDMDCRNALASALEEAVLYTVKGSGRSASKGLSFCFAPNMSPEEMDVYARNCQSAPYLALLDAVNAEWTAPEQLYEQTRRLTPIEDMDAYRLEWETEMYEGLPALRLTYASASLRNCQFRLYRLNEESGTICLLGSSDTLVDWDDEGNSYFLIDNLTTWPAIDGVPCSIELVDEVNNSLLYNTPIQMEEKRTNLRVRCYRFFDEASKEWVYQYESLGLWDGYDKDTRMPARAVTSLSQVHGREFRLLYPCCDLDGREYSNYEGSAPLRMYRSLDIVDAPLPAGTYYCSFIINDIFGHQYDTALTELTWDGKAFSPVNR